MVTLLFPPYKRQRFAIGLETRAGFVVAIGVVSSLEKDTDGLKVSRIEVSTNGLL